MYVNTFVWHHMIDSIDSAGSSNVCHMIDSINSACCSNVCHMTDF